MFTKVKYDTNGDFHTRTFILNGSELFTQITDESGSTLTNNYGETLASGTHEEVSKMWEKVTWPIVDAT